MENTSRLHNTRRLSPMVQEENCNYPYSFGEMFKGKVELRMLNIIVHKGNLSDKTMRGLIADLNNNKAKKYVESDAYLAHLQDELLKNAIFTQDQLTNIAELFEQLYAEKRKYPSDRKVKEKLTEQLNDKFNEVYIDWYYKAVEEFNRTEDKENRMP